MSLDKDAAPDQPRRTIVTTPEAQVDAGTSEPHANGQSVASESQHLVAEPVAANGGGVVAAPPDVAAGAGKPAGHVVSRRWEFLYFALRNKKLVVGLVVEIIFVLAALIGPLFAPYSTADGVGAPRLGPSAQHLLGTTYFGADVFSQLLTGLRASYLVGFLGALCAALIGLAIGFAAGWRGGMVDEGLQLFTNVVITIPPLVLLIVIASYMTNTSAFIEAVLIGVTQWTWVARAVRAQTFSLKNRDFVDLARLSGKRGFSIVVKDIAPNMASYLFLVFVLLFASSMLLAVSLDFIGLGPTATVSIGDMMNKAMLWNALDFHMWWWFIPPGAVMTIMVAALLIANVGLDEVFNPKLRET